MMTKEELIEKYVENVKETERLNKENLAIRKELATFSEHKVGEIIEWKEVIKKRVEGGSIWRPAYKVVGEKLHKAVLVRIDPRIWVGFRDDVSFHMGYEFKAIKKDGGISSNHIRPAEGYKWTGEIHSEYLTNKQTDGTESSH